MEKTNDKQELKHFGTFEICDFQGDFEYKQNGLKALGALLEQGDLGLWFGNDYNESHAYRAGLNQIMEALVEKQNGMVAELVNSYKRSAEGVIDEACRLYETINHPWRKDDPGRLYKEVSESITQIDRVLDVYGAERYPQAETIKAKLINAKNRIADYIRQLNGIEPKDREPASDIRAA